MSYSPSEDKLTAAALRRQGRARRTHWLSHTALEGVPGCDYRSCPLHLSLVTPKDSPAMGTCPFQESVRS